MDLDGQTKHRIRIGGKLSFGTLPKDIQDAVKKRLAERDPIIAAGFKGELPGIKIDGKVVTKDNIHEFEKKGAKPQKVKFTRKELEKFSFEKLKRLANKVGETGRSSFGLIKDIFKHN